MRNQQNDETPCWNSNLPRTLMPDLHWLKKWQKIVRAIHKIWNRSALLCSERSFLPIVMALFRRPLKAKGMLRQKEALLKHCLSWIGGVLGCHWDAGELEGAPSSIRAVFVLCQKAGSLFPNAQIMTCTLPNRVCSPLQITLAHRRFFSMTLLLALVSQTSLNFLHLILRKKHTGNSLKHSDFCKHPSQNILIQIVHIWQSSKQWAVESQEEK